MDHVPRPRTLLLLLIRAEGMRAHQRVDRDAACQLRRDGRAAGGARDRPGASGGAAVARQRSEHLQLGDPLERYDRTNLLCYVMLCYVMLCYVML